MYGPNLRKHYEFLEAEQIKYAIRLPTNQFCRAGSAICSRAQSGDLRTMRRFLAKFSYQAKPKPSGAGLYCKSSKRFLRLIAELRPQPPPALA